ncbi:lipopolysaccharide biosynthesis protein [Muribaculum intestinale]|jgi:O-antigen/teichoic acid export membrane protein|uniref:Lipopolysaccharide biosynthesis protein n=1 Tax=Muribaculum intestinale TaxID=1796646 RepID=A0A4S2G2F6_9BACT|nr:lipopolysaccharide biosynthesis protein [Muribaculum intestinale]MCX4368658.1 lipopolysaccharide biosynthesis protein [Duncaniella sp.]MYM11389.1 oligosaccharide flippase family protein [Muribaculum intestinale]ROS81656.1 lipopolysaccharide biosynthesis protein [Muribaculaceae bacterium Isolate-042 (Harlan)]TGY75901.1 lipopolysaccharide biosynthesis protein [Muribaculum intestinale]
MAGVKSLAKDTAIYGVSSIVGRFLNWCLVPLYTRLFPEDMYGVVTYVYSIVALTLIILTYGMETGFFRFANHERYSNPDEVYSTSLTSLGFTSTLFFALVLLFLEPVSRAMECGGHESYVWMMALAVAIDAYSCIPFAYLRYKKRPVRFAMLKLVNIGLNIVLNIFFLLICPWLMRVAPGWVEWFYVADFGIGYIFLSNLIASAVTLLMLLPDIVRIPLKFNGRLLREMLAYSFPLLVLGIAGIMNQTLDKILYPVLATSDAMAGLGIYGANYKIAIVMVMFIQAFRFAYEPFIFSQSRERGDNKLQAYRDAMKYFVIFALFIFLGVMYYLDILRYFVRPDYWAGLKVVPVIMAAEFFFGIFFNLSLWYKLTDKTVWGTWFSLLGLAVTVVLNVLLVPRYGYMGCAWAAFCCYGVMMLASYFVGNAKYPIGYNVGRLIFYVGLAGVLYPLGCCIELGAHWADFIYRGALLAVYVFVVMRREHLSPAMIIPRKAHR